MATITWNNDNATNDWNDADNWDLDRVPAAGDDVVFDSTSTDDCNAASGDVPQDLGSIDVQSGYTGIITFAANFAEGPSQELDVTGDVDVNGGTLVLTGRVIDDTTGEGVTINAANFTVGSGATVHSDRKGFGTQAGPGKGLGTIYAASHGGRGGCNVTNWPYGSATAPVTLGSGGGGGTTEGGGALKVDVSAGAITVNGTVRCNGGSVGNNYGGGAGGSIYLICGTFAGSGLLQADGGGTNSCGGGAGRVAVSATTVTYTGDYSCDGGSRGAGDPEYYEGADGTLSLPSGTDLTVNCDVGLEAGTHTLGDVVVKAGKTLTFHGSQSGTGHTATGTGCVLNASSFEVEATGIVEATREGFRPNDGPGRGNGTIYAASHGGWGGNNTTYGPYGSETAPETLGSGGGGGRNLGGNAVKIDVGSGAITVNGTVRANGGAEANNYGGGAGGSVYLLSGTLAGSGAVEAKGGSPNSYGGGGGRIAFSYSSSSFSGTTSAAGGTGSSANGEDGTVYYPAGWQVTKYYYDGLDRQKAVEDADDGLTYFQYDKVGNNTKVLDANGHASDLYYDAVNRLEVEVDALSGSTYYGYDSVGNQLRVVDQKGQTSYYAYDELGRLVSVKDPEDGRAVQSYDSVGRQLEGAVER